MIWLEDLKTQLYQEKLNAELNRDILTGSFIKQWRSYITKAMSQEEINILMSSFKFTAWYARAALSNTLGTITDGGSMQASNLVGEDLDEALSISYDRDLFCVQGFIWIIFCRTNHAPVLPPLTYPPSWPFLILRSLTNNRTNWISVILCIDLKVLHLYLTPCFVIFPYFWLFQ